MTFALFSYVADLSASISVTSFILAFVFGLISVMFFFHWFDLYDKTTESAIRAMNYSKKCALVSFMAIFICMAIPSARTINIAQIEWIAKRPFVAKTIVKIANWFDSSFVPEFKEVEISK